MKTEGAIAIAEGIANSENLKILDIGIMQCSWYKIANNYISDEGAISLAQTLKKLKCLNRLDIDSNSIGHKGSDELAKALIEHKDLRILFISKDDHLIIKI